MARTLKNRVRETTASTGTGDITPAGAVARYRSFASSGLTAGVLVPYLIEVPSGAWEIGNGTYTATGTIQRTTFEDSSTGSVLSLTGEVGTTISIVASTAALAEITALALAGSAIATASVAGIIKAGPGLTVGADGTLAATQTTTMRGTIWRLLIHTTAQPNISQGANQAAMAVITLATSPRGPQAATGGTVQSSSDTGTGGAAAMAFDTDANSYWNCGTACPPDVWIQYTFPTAVSIAEVRLLSRGDTLGQYQAFALWDLQVSSDNGVTFSTVQAFSSGTWVGGQVQAFTVTGASGAVAGPPGAPGNLPVPTASNTSLTFVQADLVPTVRVADGATIYVPTQNLVGNKTIDQLAAGTAITTATQFPVAQGGSLPFRVTGAQLADFQLTSMNDYRLTKKEVSTGTVAMDTTNANAVFVFTAPGTLTFSAVTNLVQAGFIYQATVIADGGAVSFGAGITTTGVNPLPDGQIAIIRAYTRSDGTARVIAHTPSAGGTATTPTPTPTPVATMTITGCTGMTVGGTMTVSGTFTNGTPTGLTYALDGAAAVAAVNPSIGAGTFTFAFAAPAAGAHSVVVTGTGGNTATSAAYAFTVTAAAGTQPYSVSGLGFARTGASSNLYAELHNAAGTVLYTPTNPAPGGAPKMGFTQTNVAPTSPAQFIQQPGNPPATDFYGAQYYSGWGYMPTGIYGWVFPADGSPVLAAGGPYV